MRRYKFACESLEPRRLLAADADVILDMWPGPLHSDPVIIGTLEDGSLAFRANTPEGLDQYFKTDGTLEGTVPIDESELPKTETPEPPVITRTITHLEDYLYSVETTYSDSEGRSYYHQMNAYDYTGEGDFPVLENVLTVGGDVLVRIPLSLTFEEELWYLASGSHDTWIQLSTQRLETSGLIVIDDTLFLHTFEIGVGSTILQRYDGALQVPAKGVYPLDSAIYVMTATEVGRMTVDGYQPWLDVTTLEFPSTVDGIYFATEEYVIATIRDPVYGAEPYYVSPDVAYRIADLAPGMDSSGPHHNATLGPYEFFINTPTRLNVPYTPYLFDGTWMWPVDLTWVQRRPVHWIDNGSGAIAFVEYTGIEQGTELVVRHLLPGDVNLDGYFDSSDLVELMARGHYEDGIASNSNWLTGDFNDDGEFDSSDLVTALAEGWYRTTSASATAPV